MFNSLLYFDLKIFGLKEYTKKNVSEKEEMPKFSITLCNFIFVSVLKKNMQDQRTWGLEE